MMRCSVAKLSNYIGLKKGGIYPLSSPKLMAPIMHMSSTIANDHPVLTEQRGRLLIVDMNRPKALNSLTPEMCEIMNSILRKINTGEPLNEKNDKVGAFIVRGRGGKAFCAGGDVKSIWQGLQSENKDFDYSQFFRVEYMMNNLLGSSLIPQISFWDGIVMGGGVGLSIFGEYRVATEKALFAMPETAIGLFPDVGGSAWLPHLEEGYGNYLGLTGARLGPNDLLHTKIATHFVASAKLPELEAAIEQGLPLDPTESRDHIKNILDAFSTASYASRPAPETSMIPEQHNAIVRCFGKEMHSVEAILAQLQIEKERGGKDAAWASKTLDTLNKMSPTSLKITFAQLKHGAKLALPECLKMEFRMMMSCMEGHDFREGIRAVLVDKDNNPKWQPAHLEDVTEEMVKSYFQ